MPIIATAAYPIERLDSLSAYQQKLEHWVSEAARNGAELALFPEYAAMELSALSAPEHYATLPGSIQAVAEVLLQIDHWHAQLADRFNITIVAGSAPALDPRFALPVNRVRVFLPDGSVQLQDKQIMTRFEREHWQIGPGLPLKAFDTPCARCGICICYDSEFPLLARSLVQQGVELILVPSCTDTRAGYHRVRTGAKARALEGQCVVAMACTVGDADWSPAVDRNTGAAAVFAPSDYGFPETGVLAEGAMDVPGWVYAEFDLEQIRRVREDGQVLNHQHWSEQLIRLGIEDE